ncbi:Uncharacterized protein Adt_26831 [Abeliophyllum distichum]|uniref:Uncharacterized protein n=1 Tax=Abeliophyllum distichum TaxID=126358 RepID=A0ABD1RS85_9LAMI
MERPNACRYESMTKLSPHTMRILLGELTQDIVEQFGTMPPVMANNYLLTNKFKNKEHDEEITEENEEAACTLECGEGASTENQFTHGNDREEDDEMTCIEEEIDLEAERRIRRVSYNNLLGQLYQEGNPVVGLLDEPFGRSFNYYVLYGTPTMKKKGSSG